MRLNYQLDTGWPSNLKTINQRVGAIKRRSCAFKIGITNSPRTRIRQYEDEHPRHYGEMLVLYRTSSRKNAAELEKLLISKHQSDRRNRNRRGGGGGRPGRGLRHYLYIVRRHRSG